MFIKKIDFRWADMDLLGSLLSLFNAFKDINKELYLVGGCVRDLLLGKTPKDYDLCTNATPDEVKALLAERKYYDRDIEQWCSQYFFVDTGLKHGTVTVFDSGNSKSFEITTYRIDGACSDCRHPDAVVFTTSLEEDLKRRDLTINSFAYNLSTRELLALDESYFKDLEYGVIRAVGDPEERFSEDALRMLRALRFMAQLNFSIDAATFAAIKKLSHLMAKISKERIRDEFTKILMSDNPQVMELVAVAGLEPYCFGGQLDDKGCVFVSSPMSDCLNCEHDSPWHYADVFHHTMDVVRRVPKKFELRWAAFFHDFGKPATKRLKEGTTDHYNYHGHPEVSAEMALVLMDILKFSNEQKDLIYKFVKYHDADFAYCRNATFKSILVDIGVDNFQDYIKLRFADAMAHRLTKDTKWAIDAISKMLERFDKTIVESQALTVKDLAINGYDIIDDGFLKGKEIGDCLRWMLDTVLEHPEYNTREKLLELLQAFKEMVFQSS